MDSYASRRVGLQIAILLLVGLLASIAVAAQEDRSSETIAALREAFAQWRQDVTCKSQYTLKIASAGSIDEVDSNTFFASITPLVRGVFNKNKSAIRMSVEDQRGLTTSPLAGNERMIEGQNIDEDAAGNAEVTLTYTKAHEKLGGHAVFEPVGPLSTGEPRCRLFARNLNPVYLLGACENDPFFGDSFHLGKASHRISTPEGGKVVVVSQSQHNDYACQSQTVWDISDATPIVTRAKKVRTDSMGNTLFTVSVRASDFQDVPGGRLARRIVFAQQAKDGAVRAIEWLSNDLGDTLPTKGDFDIAVETGTRIIGLKDPVAAATVATLNILDYSGGDLLDLPDSLLTVGSGSLSLEVNRDDTNGIRRPWLVLCNVVVIAVLLLALVYRRRIKKQKAIS